MIEKCKDYFKNNFSNSPKAKVVIAVATIAIITMTFISVRKTVTIKIDGKEETFITYKGTVKDVLNSKGVELADKDKVQPSLNVKVSENDTILVKRAVTIQLTANGKELAIDTAEDTVGDMLKSETEDLKNQGIEFREGTDEIAPALDTEIQKDLKIQLVKVDVKEEVINESIAFDIVESESKDLDKGYEEVTQVGASGEKEVIYEVVYKDGKEFARNIKGVKVTKDPVNQLVVKGTRQAFASRDGSMVDYVKLLHCESTAYYGGGRTATGTTPRRNPGGHSTIAVDPRVIPLGSLVYVEGYGYAVAEDTGGAIKGNIVDVYVNSYDEAIYGWGRKYNVPVYIVAYPGQW